MCTFMVLNTDGLSHATMIFQWHKRVYFQLNIDMFSNTLILNVVTYTKYQYK